MRTNNIAIVFSLIITIFGLHGAFAPRTEGNENEEQEETEKFDLQEGKQLLLSMLDYINNLQALAGEPSYDTIKNQINGATNLDSLIAAGTRILENDNTGVNLAGKATANVGVARVMKETFQQYLNNFWQLLDNNGLDGARIPLAKKLRAIQAKFEETWMGHEDYGTTDLYD